MMKTQKHAPTTGIRILLALGACIIFLFVAPATPAYSQFAKPSLLVSGMIADAETGAPLKARVAFINPAGVEENKVRTNSSGKYQAVLKPGQPYYRARHGIAVLYGKRNAGPPAG